MLTIFTPTYNRAYILPRLYKSLLEQTNKNFEWIIVDDGSTDKTHELVEEWIKDNKISISYFFQENQGKPMAHNLGAQKANGEIFTCVDSDDYLTKDSVDIILEKYKKIKEIEKHVGIVGIKVFENQKPVGTYMPQNIEYSTLYDLYNKYKYKGETILIFKTNILKKYEFPKIEGEKFISEIYLYDKIDQEGKLLIMQEAVYVCEYLADGYTNNSRNIIKNNPKGYILCAEQRMKIAHNLRTKYVANSKYVLGHILAKENGYINKSPNKFLTILAIPSAYIFYMLKYKMIKEVK